MPQHGPRSAAHRRRDAALRPGHENGVWRTLSPPRHCEEPLRRSNPELLRREILDCFAPLAMTEYDATARSSATSRLRTRFPVLAAKFARALLRRSPSRAKRAQGRPGADNAPAVCCAKGTRRKPHSSIQVVPITRPSLRDGRTAYAALSREPSSFWPPSPLRNSPAPRRLTRLPPPQGLDRSNDGQDHTVLPYARFAISPQFSRPCRRSRKLTGETNLTAPFVRAKPQGSRRAIRPTPATRARRCRVHRKPGSRQ
jgi:hypothetical protein